MYRPGDPHILGMLAAELEEACIQLEDLGVVLCRDTKLAAAEIRHLQSLDHVAQRCASIAAILRSDDIEKASRMAKLESIASRSHSSRSDSACGDFCEF